MEPFNNVMWVQIDQNSSHERFFTDDMKEEATFCGNILKLAVHRHMSWSELHIDL